MFARVASIQPGFPQSEAVTVECDVTPRGLHSFTVVGLPDKAVEEARDRISSAIKHSGFTSPKSKNHKVILSLAPADVKKEGAVFDLPMAIAYLLASEELTFNVDGISFVGELALDGTLRPIRGALASALGARGQGQRILITPKENAEEAAYVSELTVLGARTLGEVLDHLTRKKALEPEERKIYAAQTNKTLVDMGDIAGQESAKRALEIAAAGRHNVAFIGPPGTGKSMLASALSGILPPLTFEESIEVTAIHSVAGVLKDPIVTAPPFRAPHHTASYVSLVGGGAQLKPGEVTLAHRGVLFLDEFPEFDRRALESLREPLENRSISVSRAAGSVTFPANIMLVAAMNPPPFGADFRELKRFEKKLSGALVDRIDVWVDVPNIAHEKLSSKAPRERSESIQKRIALARSVQGARMEKLGLDVHTNSELPPRALTDIRTESAALSELERAARTLNLSPRSFHRVLRLARTIADLEHEDSVKDRHIFEALQYRPKLKSAT